MGLAVQVAAEEPVQTRVEGLTGKALENVQEVLVLPFGLVREGKVDRLWLERFARQAEGQVRSALEPFGYYAPKITITIEKEKDIEALLLVRIEPGNPTRVVEVHVSVTGPGAEEAGLKARVAAFPLRQGDVLLQPVYDQARDAMKARAKELGYMKAEFTTHEIRITKSTSSAVINLVLHTGRKYYFKDVTFSGAPNYPDSFMRRYLEFKPKDAFSFAKLGESQINLTNSERFKDVVLTPTIPESDDDRVPVNVSVKEAPRRSLRTGVGYGTDTGARFTARYRDLNMVNRGHEFYSNLFVSETLQGLETGYIWPSHRDFKSATSLRLNIQSEQPDTYTSDLVSLGLDKSHSFSPGSLGTIYIKLQRENYTTAEESSVSTLVVPGARITTDHYDNLTRPTRGFHYALDVHGVLQPLSSEAWMLQVLGDTNYLFPLPGKLSLLTRIRAGGTWSQYSTAVEMPPSLRFYAGGSQTVRGYDYKSLGPLDEAGAVEGGKHILSGTVELERALGAKWGVSLFYDAGNAFNSWSDFSLYKSAGIGIHFYSPVGALNVSVARQIGVDDPAYQLSFTMGFTP